MKYHFLTDESEKSLAPFFSRHVLDSLMAAVAIAALVLVVFWSRQSLAEILAAGNVPTVFFLVFAATLLAISYVNLCCGAGELVRRGYFIMNYQTEEPVYEKEIAFYRYGLIEFFLHTALLLLPLLPLLSLAAFSSAVSLISFTMAVSILFTTSLYCRLSGFLVYLIWGRSSTLGYFVARAQMIVVVIATIFVTPAVNPLRLLHRLNQSPDGLGPVFAIYTTVVSFAILVLILVSNALVKRHMNRRNELN
ncbi:hypothetical protein D1AOALGA4SA_2617 [Olavius algarvensis Delta 1 endosymbiont]|nr:hypothetical protein D1AOALGA4SA_2617 [Olavius algarvensis Delta 1 endosymbiont]